VRLLVFLSLLVALAAARIVLTGGQMTVLDVSPGDPCTAYRDCSSGRVAVYLVRHDKQRFATEVYEGEVLYLVVDLSRIPSVQPTVYPFAVVEVVAPNGTVVNTIRMEGHIVAGIAYGVPVRVEGPVLGRGARLRLSVGGMSAYVSYDELVCPPVEVVVNASSRYFINETAEAVIYVRNRGQAGYRYTVVYNSTVFGSGAESPFIGAGGTAAIRLTARPRGYVFYDTLSVQVMCRGVVVGEGRASYSVVARRPGPLVLLSPSSLVLRLGEEASVSLRVKNLGGSARVSAVYVNGTAARAAGAVVPSGGEGEVAFRFVPGAVFRTVEVAVEYVGDDGSPGRDVFLIPASTLVRMSLSAVDSAGAVVPVGIEVDGKTGVEWVSAGVHVVRAPEVVDLGDVRLVFKGWRDGASGAVRRVEALGNVELVAVYDKLYRVRVVYSPLNVSEAWVPHGGTFRVVVPQFLYVGGSRYRLKSAPTVNGTVVVTAPLEVRAEYVEQFKVEVALRGEDGWVERREAWADVGEAARVEVPEVVDKGGVRYVFAGWRDGAGGRVRTAAGPASFEALYAVEYRVVVKTPWGERVYWIRKGEELRVNASEFAPAPPPGVKYEPESPVVVVRGDGPRNVTLSFVKYFFVGVASPYPVVGGGWYREGDVAVLKPEKLQYGFLVVDSFAGWEVGGRVVRDAELRLSVDGPVEVKALWVKDYTQLIVLAVAAGAAVGGVLVLARVRGRRRRVAPLGEEETRPYAEEKTERIEDKTKTR